MSEIIGQHNFLLQYGGTFPSVNEMYQVGRARGGKSWIYLNPSVKEFKEWVIASLDMQGSRDIKELYRGKKVMVDLSLLFTFSHNFWVRDISNLVKATEDALKDSIGIDDRFTKSLEVNKVLNDKDNYEYLIISMEVREIDESSLLLSKWG